MTHPLLNNLGRAKSLLTSLRGAGVDEKILEFFELGVVQGEAEICKEIPLDTDEENLLRAGKLIDAIKHFRIRVDTGLYGAKIAIDYWREQLGYR